MRLCHCFSSRRRRFTGWAGLRSLCCFVLFQLEAKHEDLLLCKRKSRGHVGSKGPRVLYNGLCDSLGLCEPSDLQKKGETLLLKQRTALSRFGAFGACVVTCFISFKLSTKYFDLLLCKCRGRRHVGSKGPRLLYNEPYKSLSLCEPSVIQKRGETSLLKQRTALSRFGAFGTFVVSRASSASS